MNPLSFRLVCSKAPRGSGSGSGSLAVLRIYPNVDNTRADADMCQQSYSTRLNVEDNGRRVGPEGHVCTGGTLYVYVADVNLTFEFPLAPL